MKSSIGILSVNQLEKYMQVITQQHQTPRRMEDVQQVGSRIGRSRSWIWGAVRRGEFPAPARLSARCTRFDSYAVDRWIADQFAKEQK